MKDYYLIWLDSITRWENIWSGPIPSCYGLYLSSLRPRHGQSSPVLLSLTVTINSTLLHTWDFPWSLTEFQFLPSKVKLKRLYVFGHQSHRKPESLVQAVHLSWCLKMAQHSQPAFNLPFSNGTVEQIFSSLKLHAEQRCKAILWITSLKFMLKGRHWALFAQIMQLNFGGQTAALPEESISKPKRSIGHKTQIPRNNKRNSRHSSCGTSGFIHESDGGEESD